MDVGRKLEDIPQIIMSETPRGKRLSTADDRRNTVFHSVQAKMEGARTSLEASRQLRSSEVDGSAPPQTAIQKPRNSVLTDSGIVDFKGILRKYREDRQVQRKNQSMHNLPGP